MFGKYSGIDTLLYLLFGLSHLINLPHSLILPKSGVNRTVSNRYSGVLLL